MPVHVYKIIQNHTKSIQVEDVIENDLTHSNCEL